MMKIIGYTLLECLITLTIISILSALTIPNFFKSYQHTQSALFKQQLFHLIEKTRTQAILQNKTFIICPSENDKTCDKNWTHDLIVLHSGELLSVLQNPIKNSVLHWRAFPRNTQQFIFLPDGTSNFENGSFWFCLPHQTFSDWMIVVNRAGRARVEISRVQVCS